MIGGILAGLVTTLFVVPSLFSLVVRGQPPADEDDIPDAPRRPRRPPSTDIVSAEDLPPRLAGPEGSPA